MKKVNTNRQLQSINILFRTAVERVCLSGPSKGKGKRLAQGLIGHQTQASGHGTALRYFEGLPPPMCDHFKLGYE
jgi:hypothetical protein